MGSVRGVILDRDGVINVDSGYLHRIEECVFVDGIVELLREFAARGFRLIIATNQSGIGRGYFSEVDFQALMAAMLERLAAQGIVIDAVYHCPDHPTEGIGPYRRENNWRKPGPGMLLQAIADLGLDPAASWAIGDKDTDRMAAEAAGIGQFVLLDPVVGSAQRRGDIWVVPTLAAIRDLLPA